MQDAFSVSRVDAEIIRLGSSGFQEWRAKTRAALGAMDLEFQQVQVSDFDGEAGRGFQR